MECIGLGKMKVDINLMVRPIGRRTRDYLDINWDFCEAYFGILTPSTPKLGVSGNEMFVSWVGAHNPWSYSTVNFLERINRLKRFLDSKCVWVNLNYTTLHNFHVTILVHLTKKDSFVLILAGMQCNVCKFDQISSNGDLKTQ